jgi:hypothetical protein
MHEGRGAGPLGTLYLDEVRDFDDGKRGEATRCTSTNHDWNGEQDPSLQQVTRIEAGERQL